MVLSVNERRPFANQLAEAQILRPELDFHLDRLHKAQKETVEELSQGVKRPIRSNQAGNLPSGRQRSIQSQAWMPAQLQRATATPPALHRFLRVRRSDHQHAACYQPPSG